MWNRSFLVDFGIPLSRLMVAAERRGEKFSPEDPPKASRIGPFGPMAAAPPGRGGNRAPRPFRVNLPLPDGQPGPAAGRTGSG